MRKNVEKKNKKKSTFEQNINALQITSIYIYMHIKNSNDIYEKVLKYTAACKTQQKSRVVKVVGLTLIQSLIEYICKKKQKKKHAPLFKSDYLKCGSIFSSYF